MINEIKKSNEIKIHLESGIGFYVIDHILHKINLNEIDDVEVANYIIENGQQVRYESDVWVANSDIFAYCIDNGGEYELNMNTVLHSFKYYNSKDFKRLVEKAKDHLKRKYNEQYIDIYDIANTLEEMYPDIFLKVNMASCCIHEC